MTKFLLISEDSEKENIIKDVCSSDEVITSVDEVLIFDILKVEEPDIVIIDGDFKSIDLKPLCRKIKQFPVIVLMIMGETFHNKDITHNVNLFIKSPIDKNLLSATIDSSLKTRQTLLKMTKSNQELARSLYQLNVLYDTSSQLAGSLDKDKLLKIMTEGIEKSLNFELSCTLMFRSDREPVLLVNSLYKVSDRLLEALKLRAILSYKSLLSDPPFDIKIGNLKIEKTIKHNIQEYDFSVLRYDNMFAPIMLNDEFFGFTEIYREKPFTTEDATCFQTLVQQVTIPLKSASFTQELKATNRKLQKLERLKSEFISIVSHELRTPLTAIKNAMDIILSGKAGDMTENIQKFVTMGKRNAIRLTGIVNDLLDISKIEAGKMDFKFELTHIEPVIEVVKNNLAEVAREKELTIKYVAGDTAEVYADSNRIEQVLTNLVSNAIKFTPNAGEIEITSKIVNARDLQYDHCFEEDIKNLKGNYLQVCVEDHGIGIERKDLNHVFDKFAQIENSLSRQVGGSGLGLPIARQLMESHNGAIWCDSEINKGSRFYFVIPVANDKSNFNMIKKQLIQKARSSGNTVAIIKIKSTKTVIENLIREENLLNKTYMSNSLIEDDGMVASLSMVVVDGDKPSAEFLKKKIDSLTLQKKNVYGECDIMYSYEIEGDTHEKDSYSR
ncbi:MAG: HAMP domain-containing histidine kinase [Cyanobacteria bacterium SIG28]|nr:HAMP domain-containing histidine kinase [Cyanobacteria bacterium SIG28]